ncbi:unnamed protein product [Trichogramma brassicae]|uniref:Uncharacterized protein n=1 Tax=Trichogramma brassicae TaxID=86971 RepID=A0A6H5HZC3_9HYME|nr:unnamed protein product [Trichogramma brassicae]
MRFLRVRAGRAEFPLYFRDESFSRFRLIVETLRRVHLLRVTISSSQAQENAKKILSPNLVDCYENPDLAKWNLLPHDLNHLVAIIRKIENAPGFGLSVRDFAGALLHRFRQDGIVKSPTIHSQSGVLPYAPMGMHFRRHAKTLQVIPGTAAPQLDLNSITPLERCSLHAMISSSIDKYVRQDESRDCQRPSNSYQSSYQSRSYNSRRYRRGLSKSSDVETLSADQIKALKAKNESVDPDSQYPELPPNHPLTRNGRYAQNEPPLSNCPIENGVVKTP